MKRNRKQKKKPRCKLVGVCRDCGERRDVDGLEFLHASPARCYQCGGMLDRRWVRRYTSTATL